MTAYEEYRAAQAEAYRKAKAIEADMEVAWEQYTTKLNANSTEAAEWFAIVSEIAEAHEAAMTEYLALRK